MAQEQVIEEIVTIGIRGGLQQSMDVKRNSNGVVDAISAEDIGKFPDTNLAESMQRITGVSINRVNGEGSEVTVRGFGAGFNLVTLNGRQLPAANVNTITGGAGGGAGAQGNSRSFDFSTLASEGVSGIQVYKTGRANSPSGGIGATLNIQTLKPLEATPQASLGGKVVNDTGGDDLTGEMSGLINWRNEDSTFGVSAFGSWQERDLTGRSVGAGGFQMGTYNPANTTFGTPVQVNEPSPGQLFAYPNNVSLGHHNIQRERVNGMLTMQFAPSDRLMITADALYTSTSLENSGITDGIWYSRQFETVEFDGNPVVTSPVLITEYIGDGVGKDFFYANWGMATVDEMQSYGLNLDYEVNDGMTLNLDYATSSSTAGGDGPQGKNSWRFNVAGAVAGWQAAYYGTGLPNVAVNITDGAGDGDGIFEIGDVGSQAALTNDSIQEADIDQFQANLNWDVTDSINVDFGVGYMETEMHQAQTSTLDFLGGWGVGNTGDVPQGLIAETCTVCEFGDLNFPGVPGVQSLAPAGASLIGLGEVSWRGDAFTFFNGMAAAGDYGAFGPDNLTRSGFDDNIIGEDIFSVYAQAVMDGFIGEMPTTTVLGVRYESTDVSSRTLQNVVNSYTWESDNDFRAVFGDAIEPLTETYSYSHVLPNLDFSVDITDQWKLRASLSKTLARPQYNNLYIKTASNNPPTPTLLGGVATGSKGNVALDPLESNNFDLSLEYYYGESSYVSIGYYDKSVSNFIGTEQVPQNLFGITDVTSGAPGTLSARAVEALNAGGFAVNEQNLFTMAAILDNPQDFPNGAADYIDPTQPGGSEFAFDVLTTYDIFTAPGDPLMIFEVQQPVNNETANLDGFEVAVQHFFGESGFGLQANATIVQGDVGFDNGGDPTIDQFALEGLSDSANLVFIYELDRIAARVAYNWRDAFLDSTNVSNRMPRYIDGYEQLDFHVSYRVSDQLTVSLDGLNITEEGQRAYGRTENLLWYATEADARYVLSARYNF